MKKIANRPRLIGICGMKGAGKDTVASHLISVNELQRLAFADPLKDALAAMFSVPRALFDDPATKDTDIPELFGKSPRFWMKSLGTDWGRNTIGKGLWVDLLERRLVALRKTGASIVVADVRFENEAEMVRGHGGQVWRVERGSESADDHETEKGLPEDMVDEVIFNTGTLNILYAQVGVALARYDRWNAGEALRDSTL